MINIQQRGNASGIGLFPENVMQILLIYFRPENFTPLANAEKVSTRKYPGEFTGREVGEI